MEHPVPNAMELICGVCFKAIKTAITLQCSHSFCSACIESTMAIGKNNTADITCVLCGTHTIVDDFGPLVNAQLDQEIALLRSGNATTFMCQWCDLVPATMQCNTCAAAYCKECMHFVHKHSARTKHAIGPLMDSPNSFLLRCSCRGHEDYKAEFFCTECDSLCCAYCLRVSPHFEHQNTDIATAAKEAKRRIAAEKSDLDRMKSRLDEVGSEIKELNHRYESTYRESVAAIGEKFARYRRDLDTLEAELCEQLEKLYGDGKTALQSSRLDFLNKMNTFLVALLKIEGSSTDSKVLENTGFLKRFRESQMQYLPLVGKCFVTDVESPLELPEVGVRLDLRSDCQALQIGCGATSGQLVTPDESLALISFSSGSRPSPTGGRKGLHAKEGRPGRNSFLNPASSSPTKMIQGKRGSTDRSRIDSYLPGRQGDREFRGHSGRRGGKNGRRDYDSPDDSSETDTSGREGNRGRYTRRRPPGGRPLDSEGYGGSEYRPLPQPSNTSRQYWGKEGNNRALTLLDRFLTERKDRSKEGNSGRAKRRSPGRRSFDEENEKSWSSRLFGDMGREKDDEMVDTIVAKVRREGSNSPLDSVGKSGSGTLSSKLGPRRRRSFVPKDAPPTPRPKPECCSALRRPLRFSFPVDDDVDTVTLTEGLQFRCIARGNPTIQIGLRSAETVKDIANRFPEDNGIISWRIRLDHVADLFVGVVEYGSPAGTSGFFWKPACEKVLDGDLGRVTEVGDNLPLCHTGDVVGFLYDSKKSTLRLFVNNKDLGELVTDLPGNIGACFILYPGETVTVLF